MLYKSQLRLFPGRLKSRWSGLFIISKVFANGVVDILDTRDYHTFMVNEQRLKIYSGGEIPAEKERLMGGNPSDKSFISFAL